MKRMWWWAGGGVLIAGAAALHLPGQAHAPLPGHALPADAGSTAANRATSGESAAPRSPTEIAEAPLALHGGRLVVTVEASDGPDLSFLLSTSNSVTVLSEAAARRVEAGATLTLGGHPVPVEEVPTEATIVVEGRSFGGILTSDALNDFNVLLDAPGSRMLLAPTGRRVEWPGVQLSEPVPLRVYHGIVLGLDVELNGHAYPAMLDLGAPVLQVNPRVMEEGEIRGTTARSLRVGDATFPNLPVEVSDRRVIRMFSPNGDGFVVVGAPLAASCALSLSWIHRELRTCLP